VALSYGAATALTWTPASLATATYDGSAAVVNTTNLYEDVVVGGFFTTGTTPTTAKRISVFLYGSWDNGTTYSAGMAGTDGDAPDAGETGGLIGPIWVIDTDATSDHRYEWGPVSLIAILGHVPDNWGLVVYHDTGVNFNSTAGNHEAKYRGLKY
jgi:hypothetical protein